MGIAKPIETKYGFLEGRDSIFLDEISFTNGTNHLHMKGSINGSLCSKPVSEKWIPYELTFEWIVASKITGLDAWESQKNWYNETSFDEILESNWLKEVACANSKEHKQFIILTYDDVVEVVCRSFHLNFGRPHA